MPVTVGALDMIKKEIDKHINKIPGNPSLYMIYRKIVLCRKAHLLRRVQINETEKYHSKEAAKTKA